MSSLTWIAVGDPVMGGCSISNVQTEANGIRFSGVLSLSRGGGFASIRAILPAPPPADTGHLVLQLLGDGRRYKLGLGRLEDPKDTQWQQAFTTTAGKPQTLRLPLAEFVRVRRGRPLTPQLTLRPSEIRRIGLTLADGKQGPFTLCLLSLTFLPG